jgi:hypothetical protein
VRVSEYYALGRTQPTLDFVDVDIERDVPVFINPRALHELRSPWAQRCEHLVQDFFGHILMLIQIGEQGEAESLLATLKEPNETRLGLSTDSPAGRAMGDGNAHAVWQALSSSEPAKTGLIRDLEDTVLLVRGISTDIISDITTNIIRAPLIEYTQHVCEYYNITLQSGVASGPVWQPEKKQWTQGFVSLPVPSHGGKLLLAPKAIVRVTLGYDASEYYRHYLLERMQRDEEQANTSLVRLIRGGPRTGQRGVTKDDLIDRYGQRKEDIAKQTMKYPDVLEEYRNAKGDEPHLPMSHDQLSDVEGTQRPDWESLLAEVVATPVGRADAKRYENAIEALFTAMLYPALTNPTKQHRLHDGQKIVDLTYTNMGVSGFFKWLTNHHPSGTIMVECKNYGNEVANPEVDQLAGRFSPTRGQVGFLVCRSVQNFDALLQRCKNTAADGHGFIVPIVDDDLPRLIADLVREGGRSLDFPLLWQRFRELVM